MTFPYIGSSPLLLLVKSDQVTSFHHIMDKMQAIQLTQGEGLIFRKPGSKYMDTDSLLKLEVSTISKLLILQ